jgi:hypothetical protein
VVKVSAPNDGGHTHQGEPTIVTVYSAPAKASLSTPAEN